LDVRELWDYRELVLVLASRELKVRYRQAVVGVAWVVLQPVVMMGIWQVIFSFLQREPSTPGVPYVLSFLAGYLPWQMVATSLRDGSTVLVNNRQLVTKVYFPRIMLPLSSVLCALCELAICGGLMGVLMLWYGILPRGTVLAVVPLGVLLTLLSLGVALWLSALNALYRDIGYIVPFLIQVGFLVSPVAYETGQVISSRYWVYGANPLVVVIEGLRWALLGTQVPSVLMCSVSLLTAVALVVSGLWYFRRVEDWIADRI
jgi:lipopolysaccharide transport system permease protein